MFLLQQISHLSRVVVELGLEEPSLGALRNPHGASTPGGLSVADVQHV